MIIDIIFLALILLAVINGYRKGFIIAIFSIVALIAGLAAAIKLSALTAGYLDDSVNISDKWLPVVSFALVFLVVVILVRLGAQLVEKTVELAMMGWLNKLGGMVLYAILYMIIGSILLYYGTKAQVLSKEVMAQSVTYNYIIPWGPLAMNGLGSVIPVFRNMFHDLETFFERISTRHQ